MPSELQLCGQTIVEGSSKYEALYNWFSDNKSPWRNTPASYIPYYVYSGNNFYVNVLKTGVIVNANIAGWTQVHITGNTESIYGKCN